MLQNGEHFLGLLAWHRLAIHQLRPPSALQDLNHAIEDCLDNSLRFLPAIGLPAPSACRPGWPASRPGSCVDASIGTRRTERQRPPGSAAGAPFKPGPALDNADFELDERRTVDGGHDQARRASRAAGRVVRSIVGDLLNWLATGAPGERLVVQRPVASLTRRLDEARPAARRPRVAQELC
jgi:hypothetical protein